MILSEFRPATDSVYESWAATNHAQPLAGQGTKDTSIEARGMTRTQSPDFQSGEGPVGATALELQSTELFSFGFPAADSSSWDDGLDLAALYHGTYADFSFALTTSECELEHDITLDPSTDDLDIDQSPPPPPTFLDTRSSPDPQEGQTMKYGGFLRKAFKSRQQLYNTADQRTECDPGRAPQHHHGRNEKISYAPLLGGFPMSLAEDDEELWEPENLARVPTLTRGTHDFIVAQFKNLNTTDNHITQFATGRFPCLSACNAFMQLFFESFNPTLPMIHQGTFDPANEPWQLVLAVIATVCRFSRVAKAVQCGDLLQDLVRQAFNATVEKEYQSTCEPWLAQVGLLNQIGMQFSKDVRLVETAQGLRSVLDVICRKVNCFREAARPSTALGSAADDQAAWISWVRPETLRRLAYTIWLIDSQYMLFFDQPPLIPMELLRARLPSDEQLWNATTAQKWREILGQNDEDLPGNIRKELHQLYKTRTCRQTLDTYGTLMLVMGIFRNTMGVWRSSRSGLGAHLAAMEDPSQYPGESAFSQYPMAVAQRSFEFLQILCPRIEAIPHGGSLKSVLAHHCHAVGIAIRLPLSELFCYIGYRVTSIDIMHCRQRLKTWFSRYGRDARQVALHAGQLFASIRQSRMHGYYEGRAMLIACLSLWAFGENAGSNILGEGVNIAPTYRLDHPSGPEIDESWLQDGAGMRPCLAGVGNIIGVDGVSRLIHEGSRVLYSSSVWPISDVQGNALQVFHNLRRGED
ncbi:hypothetical protein LTR10_015151 [Elasticomyces elasticus]|uniref:Xylanolytic transcriptional activator regulatory domain-containing protein n=1 Tax=Exophiala sideris TaxID=1016849 RepID=A0ABR0JR10_9EURO|nr:hypothetical protein LTR10_015151 [Elasticomyces elasticus]KAK5034651.1 hypothetical protein LTR13_006307 [Exophiala sideris]KAK5040027.1 hypothetical protein LTS07_000523 [Exophiala sideris]KAK5068405.1 hypothetical protein LTR69_000524 [Exophiala sideris]KAK5187707.1 hypothetical protein LTR44_000524 [Eurotiomycetes sp. CCFEE 6388]